MRGGKENGRDFYWYAFLHFADEKSELGYEELMNEAVMLRTLQEKVPMECFEWAANKA